jgi:hypothetical protein
MSRYSVKAQGQMYFYLTFLKKPDCHRTLSSGSRIQSTNSQSISCRVTLILSSNLQLYLPYCLFLSDSKFNTHLSTTHACYMSSQSRPWFNNPNNTCSYIDLQIMKVHTVHLSQYFCYLVFVRFKFACSPLFKSHVKLFIALTGYDTQKNRHIMFSLK